MQSHLKRFWAARFLSRCLASSSSRTSAGPRDTHSGDTVLGLCEWPSGGAGFQKGGARSCHSGGSSCRIVGSEGRICAQLRIDRTALDRGKRTIQFRIKRTGGLEALKPRSCLALGRVREILRRGEQPPDRDPAVFRTAVAGSIRAHQQLVFGRRSWLRETRILYDGNHVCLLQRVVPGVSEVQAQKS